MPEHEGQSANSALTKDRQFSSRRVRKDIINGQIPADRAFLSPSMETCLGSDYRFTWKEANGRANRFAGYLAAQGIRRGDRIAVLAKNKEHAVSASTGR